MPRAVQLVRRRGNTERRVFLNEPPHEKGYPLHPPKGGMGGTIFYGNSSPAKNDDVSLDIEEKALGMSKAERQALLDRLALSLQETESSRDSGMWVLAIVRALQTRLGAGGASAYGPAVSKAHVAASKVFKPVADFISAAGLDSFTVTERQAALNYLAEMVVADAASFCKYARIPLGPKVVGQRQANVHGIFDQAFPTYLAAGLAKIVFRRLANSGDWDGNRGVAS